MAGKAKSKNAVKGLKVSKVSKVSKAGKAARASKAPKVEIRKIVLMVEDISHEGGPVAKTPHRRGAIAVVIKNPYAGGYVDDIMPMMEAMKPMGLDMAARLIAALGGAKKIEAYGKGAIVGTAGETEHCALWHVPGGYGMRELLDNSKAIVPSAGKVGAAGTRIDIPIHHREAAYVRSHFDSVEMGVPDAPRPDEIVYILAMTTGSRVHARVGGMKVSEIKVGDGQK